MPIKLAVDYDPTQRAPYHGRATETTGQHRPLGKRPQRPGLYPLEVLDQLDEAVPNPSPSGLYSPMPLGSITV